MRFVEPIRIEPAFDNREQIREMFKRHAPYRSIATYAPEGVVDETSQQAKRPVLPWFRGDWALAGKPLVEGAGLILHNKRFLQAARTQFGTSRVHPEFVVVNVNAPMPAGSTHVDNPSFYGATREDYPLPFLRVMGSSRLFERWRVVHASSISWFYEGEGGNFDYWPQGLDGPMLSEQPPFGNLSIIADTDRIYHRIGSVGDPHRELPRISPAAYIQPTGDGEWAIMENGEIRATYPEHMIRLSVLWKAEIRDETQDDELSSDHLTLDRIMGIFTADLRRQSVTFQMPSSPLTDSRWILLLQQIYVDCSLTPV